MRVTFPVMTIVLAALALSGCSDPAAYHVGDAELRAMADPPPPAKLVADTGFCRGVAGQDASRFDAATRAKLYSASFRQCMVVFGPPNLRLADLGGDDSRY